MFDEDDLDDDDGESDDAMEEEANAFAQAIEGMYETEEEMNTKLKWIEKNYKSVGWFVELLYWEVKGIAWERRYGAEFDVDDVWVKNGTKGLGVKWSDDLTKALFELHNSTNQRGDKGWRVAGENVKRQLRLFVIRMAFEYSNDDPFHNFDHACQVSFSGLRLFAPCTWESSRAEPIGNIYRF